MRSYAQFCPVARALDVVGDRWALLIVRELLVSPCRFTDLRRGLPGIASNLLAERLRALDHAGIVERANLPPPAASTVYQLTERGHALRTVLFELARWGAPMLDAGPDGDAFEIHWLVLLATVVFRDVPTADLGPLSARIQVGPASLTLRVGPDGVFVTGVPETQPDVVLTADPAHAVALITGAITLEDARADATVQVEGASAATAQMHALLKRAGLRGAA